MEQKPLINYTREAFALPLNLSFVTVMAIATGLSIGLQLMGMSFVPWEIPAFIGAGIEMLFLAVMPRNKRFLRAVNAKKEKSVKRMELQMRSMQYLQSLSQASLDNYAKLFERKVQIGENLAKRKETTSFFLNDQLNKLDTLEAYYVELLYEIERYNAHIRSDDSGELNAEITKMKAEMMNSTERVKKLYQKRLDLAMKRKEKSQSVREQLQMAEIQLDTIEDTVNYLLDQSMTLKNPEEISAMIDSLILEAEEHYETARELDSILHMSEFDENDSMMHESGHSSQYEVH